MRRGYKLFNTFILFLGQQRVNKKYKVEEEDRIYKTERINCLWVRLSKKEIVFLMEGLASDRRVLLSS